MINRFILAISVISVGQPRLNPSGPVHESYAIKCLQQLAIGQFKFIDSSGTQTNKEVNSQLLTIMTTANMTSPAFEIQQNLIKGLNFLLDFNIEVINDRRTDFGLEIYTRYCVIVTDSVETVTRKFEVYLRLNSSNSEALFLIYYSKLGRDYEKKAVTILEMLWKMSIKNVLVLIPVTLKHFTLYTLQLSKKPFQHCLENGGLVALNQCIRGQFVNNIQKYYENKISGNFSNCILDVVANKIDPFVINENEGFEITFLNEIGKILKVSFNITLTGEDSWGVKDEDGRWTNGLRQVYEDSCLGIGNFYVAPEYEADFHYTAPHWVSELVWIVPIAQPIAHWRVLTIIFSWYLWVLCISLILVCAIVFKILSFSKNELRAYKQIGTDFLLAFQIIITVAVFKHPRSDWARVPFISLAIFSIIISSVYTSSLIRYLTHSQMEPQVDSIEGVFQRGWDIGGLPVYEDIFHGAEDENSKKIHDIFQVNESLEIWLTSVGDDRDTCTMGNNFFIQYMLAKEDPILTDPEGRPKIFILEKKIFTYSLVIVTSKSFLFLDRMNYVIGLMNTFGIIKGMAKKYTNILDKVKAMQIESSVVEALSLKHLQGAFAILILGYSLGSLCVLIEIVTSFVKKKWNRRQGLRK